MTYLIISFLSGSVCMLIACFLYCLRGKRSLDDHVTSTVEEARRRAYARGYEEGNLHGRGQFITKNLS